MFVNQVEESMSGKLVQLTLFPEETSAEDTIKNMLRGLFARDTARKKEIERLMMRNLELEEVVFRMNGKIERITSSVCVQEKNP
jgi:hypothetical protein